MKKTVFKWFILFLLLSVCVGAIYLYNPLPNNPSPEALAKGSSRYDVEIVRDDWGVPHIVGDTDADASFGLAYAHAEDDYQTMQEIVAATRGVLARYKGADAAPTDYIVAVLDVWRTIETRYQSDVPADVKALAEGYAAGLNLYASRHPETTWQGLAPFRAEDVVAGFVFKTPLFYGLDKTLLDLFDDDRKAEISLVPGSDDSTWLVRPNSGLELGSNAMAISAKRSGDGVTRLLINSHQPLTGPVAWYEAHLKSNHGLDIMGGVFPGTPLILHGFNRNLGWANTVNKIDLADTYVLSRNPNNDTQYRMDEKWLDFEVQNVNIMVKLFGPFAFEAKRKVLRSVHGPVIEAKEATYALRYAGMGEVRQLEQYYRLNQAENIDDFLAAMALNALPSINYVYADKDSNIGFVHNAQYPNRVVQGDWSKDIPGDRSEFVWQGYRSFEQVPKLINPESGFVFNSNNTPFSATDGPDNLDAGNFPESMGLATNQTNRALRVMELTDGVSFIGKADLLRIKFDDRYSLKSDAYKVIAKVIAMDWSTKPELAKAVEHLKKWDRGTDKENVHAALASLTLSHIIQSDDPKGELPETRESAFRSAVSHLLSNYGKLDPQWGEVNRLQRGNLSLPVDGGPDVLRAIYSIGLSDGETYATNGDSWIAVVDWPETGGVSADVVHQFGSATADKTSPHYADQAALFAQKKWRRVDFDMQRVRANARSITRPNGK